MDQEEVVEVYKKIYDLAASCRGAMDDSVDFRMAVGLGQILAIASVAIGLAPKE
jgi:hypothetical protein